MRRRWKFVTFILLCSLLFTGCGGNQYEAFRQEPDLVVYTPLTADIYQPVIREFEDRTGLLVEVQERLEGDIVEELRSSRENFKGDVILGISKAAVEDYKSLFPEEREFTASSFVIIYNTNLVIYNEVPEKFSDLLDEKWKGQIGFLDPSTSAIYQGILDFIQNEAHQKYYINMDKFTNNTKGYYANSMEAIADGVAEGRYAAGIVTKRKAEQMIAEGKDINEEPLSIEECRISNMTVTTLNDNQKEVADQFLDFTVSSDVKKYLAQYLNYQSEELNKEGVK